jgi:hypothetical protein
VTRQDLKYAICEVSSFAEVVQLYTPLAVAHSRRSVPKFPFRAQFRAVRFPLEQSVDGKREN